MVTTIKITCDGVFIQSNSYLTPSASSNNVAHRGHAAINTVMHSPSAATSLATSTTTATSFAICSDDPSSSDGSSNEFAHSLRQHLRHLNSPKVALISATITSCNNTNHKNNNSSSTTNGNANTTFNSFSSTTSSSSSQSSTNSHTSNASQHQHQRSRRGNSQSPRDSLKLLSVSKSSHAPRVKAVDARRRYYFNGGSAGNNNNNIYWCKQAIIGSGDSGKGNRNSSGGDGGDACEHNNSALKRRAHTVERVALTRSGSSVTTRKEFRNATAATKAATSAGVAKVVAVRRGESSVLKADSSSRSNNKSYDNSSVGTPTAVASNGHSSRGTHHEFYYGDDKVSGNSNRNQNGAIKVCSSAVKAALKNNNKHNSNHHNNKSADCSVSPIPAQQLSASNSQSNCNSQHKSNTNNASNANSNGSSSVKSVSKPASSSVSSADTTRLFNFLRAARKFYRNAANVNSVGVDSSQKSNSHTFADEVDSVFAHQPLSEPTNRRSSLAAINNRLAIVEYDKSSADGLSEITVTLSDDWFDEEALISKEYHQPTKDSERQHTKKEQKQQQQLSDSGINHTTTTTENATAAAAAAALTSLRSTKTKTTASATTAATSRATDKTQIAATLTTPTTTVTSATQQKPNAPQIEPQQLKKRQQLSAHRSSGNKRSAVTQPIHCINAPNNSAAPTAPPTPTSVGPARGSGVAVVSNTAAGTLTPSTAAGGLAAATSTAVTPPSSSASAVSSKANNNKVMSSHATATQHSGQTTVVGHHRGFSQPSVTVAANSAGDPWFLQSTGHQMPPTAPLRHNKRPAPQPNHGGVGGIGIGVGAGVGSGSGGGSGVGGSGIGLANSGSVGVSLLHQQQLSQSQPHIVPPNIPPHHHNNVNQHHNAIHLSSHALNSHNLITAAAGANHSPKSPNQQQQQQQHHHHQQQQQQQASQLTGSATQPHTHTHILSTFAPQSASAGNCAATTGGVTAAAVAAVTQQQQQQHLQLLANASSNNNNHNNNLMSSSLNAAQHSAALSLHERGLPPKTGAIAAGLGGALHGSSMMLHQAPAPSSLSSSQQQTQSAISLNSVGGGGSSGNVGGGTSMSTSLHSFDINGGGVTSNAWSSSANAAAVALHSPTNASAGANQHHLQPQRKCEVKLNAMPWFHGSITRDEAEHLLQPREDGLFLVRESTNFPGDYTLCVCFQGKVEHYRVKYLENKLTIDDEEYFENLGQLVAHYEADADGLCTQLIKCLPKMGRQEFCINSKDFLDKGWVIPEADLQLRESIGKGEFGDVMLGILRSEKVAVKMLKDEGAVQKFLAEASVMTTLEHENLVKFVGLVFTSKHIYLVTEYMSKGSLVDYLRSRGRQHITKKDQINFAYDTASGMEYLEAKKVVHRDLAARNVLISEECVAKVSDFGLAREECYNLDVGKLPIKWTAPEALKNGPLNDVVKHVEVGYKMEAPDGCPPEIYEMMRQAWDLNPAKRPTFADLKVKLLHLNNNTPA